MLLQVLNILLSSGVISQVVILGAGFDTLAYLPESRAVSHAKVKFFEVDRAATQQVKRNALKSAGVNCSHVKFVPFDLDASGGWVTELEAHGFDRSVPAYVHAEGLTMYLTEQTMSVVIRGLHGLAPGSHIAMDYLDLTKFGRSYLSIMEYFGEAWKFGIQVGHSSKEGHDAVSKWLAKNRLHLVRHEPFQGPGGPGLGCFWGGVILASVPPPNVCL